MAHPRSSRLCRNILLSLPFFAAALSIGCDDGHGAKAGQEVSTGTVVATFDPTFSAYRTVTTSLGPRGAPTTGVWHFDIFDTDNNRLKGVKTHWQSSDPSVVTLPAPDLATTATDVMWETALHFQAVGMGDAILTGTVVGAKTVKDLPVSVTVNVHVTGPGISIVLTPPVQASFLNLDPDARTRGDDTVGLAAVVTDAAGEPVVGATLDWTCLGAASDGEFVMLDPDTNAVVGKGCADISTDVQHHYLDVRGYHTGYVGFQVSLQGAPEVKAVGGVVFVGAGAQLELDPPAVALVVGGERSVKGTVVDEDGSRYPAAALSLRSHNVAVVSTVGGVVRGVASGSTPGEAQSTTVTASLGILSAELGVIVYRQPANVLIAPALKLAPGAQGTVSATLVDTDGVTVIPAAATTLTWSTLDGAVATVAGSGDSATVSAVAEGTTAVRATTAAGVVGIGPVTVAAGGGGAPGCYPECIESLRRACVPAGACAMNATPPAPFSDTFYFCYADGVRIVSMSTNTGTRHSQYRPDGSLCFTIDTSFSGTQGRNVTEVWKDPAGNTVGTESYDSMAPDGGRSHSVTCGGQSFTVDSDADGCAYPDCSAQDATCM